MTAPAGGGPLLHGVLTAPTRQARDAPAVLIIAGSGPTDRDGNSGSAVRAATLKLLAHGLAERGVSSLRFDKRGIGDSAAAGPAEADLRFDAYVADAVLWAKRLQAQTKAPCVVLAGHSEGALVAALAAPKASACGIVSIAGAGRPASAVLREQLGAALPEALKPTAMATLSELEAGRLVETPPPELAALFRKSVQPYLLSWLPLDPAAALKAANRPTLILQGQTDLQTSEADARRLASAVPSAELRLLPQVNHVLKVAPLDRSANLATYADPGLPLAPGVIEATSRFVLARRPLPAKP